MKLYDAIVIGGGPGGYVCAIRLAQNGIKTALIEAQHLGGTCLNWGCIPTKSLIQNASVIDLLTKGNTFGFTVPGEGPSVDYNAAFLRSRSVVQRLRSGVEYLIQKNKIDLISDTAKLIGPNTVETLEHGSLQANHIVLATGSSARLFPDFQKDDARILTARTALELTEVPKKAVIVGAGAIGVEFAYIWNCYGCDVTLVEMMDAVLPSCDNQLSEFARQSLEKSGIHVLTGAKVESVSTDPDAVRLTVTKQGKETVLDCDHVLAATGITPNTAHIGLEQVGIKTERGFVIVDDNMATNLPGVYAIGDITGKLALAHTASAQGLLAADRIAGLPTEPICYEQIPKCVYCLPEIADIGLSEEECRAKKIPIKIGFFPFSANGKAIAMGETEGFIKIIENAETGGIIGVHMAGPHVTELISQCVPLMKLEITAEELCEAIYPHPSLSEAFWEAARDTQGKMIHK